MVTNIVAGRRFLVPVEFAVVKVLGFGFAVKSVGAVTVRRTNVHETECESDCEWRGEWATTQTTSGAEGDSLTTTTKRSSWKKYNKSDI